MVKLKCLLLHIQFFSIGIISNEMVPVFILLMVLQSLKSHYVADLRAFETFCTLMKDQGGREKDEGKLRTDIYK